MRALAALVASADPDVTALSEIDAGDALATATRFNCEWAYRGGQALLWKRGAVAHDVFDLYLPVSALRPFARRGLLRVDADIGKVPLHVFATQFAADRSAIRDLRFARSAVRRVEGNVLLFISDPAPSRIGFADEGLRSVATAPRLAIWARGFELGVERSAESENGLGPLAVVRATRA